MYRSGWAPGLYYAMEIWWKRMYFPSRQLMPSRRSIFTVDGLLVSGVAVVWVATLVFAAMATGQSAVWLVAVGFVLP